MADSLIFDWVAICGRTLEEYQQFFEIDFREWPSAKVLDCPGGTSSFAAEAMELGLDVVAIDPVYDLDADVLEARAQADIDHVIERVGKVPELFTWSFCPNLEELNRRRQDALIRFLVDYRKNGKIGRYIAANLPRLPFANGEFDLVLSGHLLFNYSDRLDYDFHRDSILEMARVSKMELRIFPIRGRKVEPYRDLERLLGDLRQHGLNVEVRKIKYEFLRGWNEILLIRK